MTVKELIELLQKQPQEFQVVYAIYSEQCLLETDDVVIIEACEPRNDGWVADKRPDKPFKKYLRIS